MIFVSLDYAAKYNCISKVSLQKLRWKDKRNGRTDRFVDGKVALNYLRPHQEELEALYFKALNISGDKEAKIIRFVAHATGIKISLMRAAFKNFVFCNPYRAAKIIEALKEFCAKTPLQKPLFEV